VAVAVSLNMIAYKGNWCVFSSMGQFSMLEQCALSLIYFTRKPAHSSRVFKLPSRSRWELGSSGILRSA